MEQITNRKRAEHALRKTIEDLKETQAEIRYLRGLLPICASCKSIRDTAGYWTQIEQYIEAHSDASFTHGICPDCARKLYPDFRKMNDKQTYQGGRS